jgi:anti-sigma B factor antagonist
MDIRTRVEGDVCILELAGRLVLGDGDIALRDEFRARLGAGERKIVLDCHAVPFMDSAGIGEVVACYKRAREAGADVKLVLSPKVTDVFAISRLQLVFDLHDDAASAVRAFRT